MTSICWVSNEIRIFDVTAENSPNIKERNLLLPLLSVVTQFNDIFSAKKKIYFLGFPFIRFKGEWSVDKRKISCYASFKNPLNQNNTYGAAMNDGECCWCLLFSIFTFVRKKVRGKERKEEWKQKNPCKYGKTVVMETKRDLFISMSFSFSENL